MLVSLRTALAASLTAGLVGAAVLFAAPAQAAPPAFVQQKTTHGLNTKTRSVTMGANTVAGNRLIVQVGVWNSLGATISSVTDNAGDTFVKLLSFTAADQTEMSVWTAVVATGGVKPAIKATATSSADIGIAALEYSGLSTVAGTAVLDTQAFDTGRTTSAATVGSGATGAVGATGGLAFGFYADSGFQSNLTAGAGFTQRAKIALVSDMDLLVEDAAVSAGATPAATVGTGANTYWLMATLVLRPAVSTPPAAPGAPTAVTAIPGNAQASVGWTAPADGGATITSYTVTPYVAGVAQTATTVTGSPAPTSAAVTGLTNGTSYTFTVQAANSVGTGPASAQSNAVTPAVAVGGSWGSNQSWPIVALSNTLLPNGSVVAWDGWQQPQPSVVWNPAQPANFTTINAPTSVFCDGAASLPDGRLLVVGGFGVPTTGNLGLADTNIFDYNTNTWTRVADMHHPRWYPSVTELADGRYVAISGNDTADNHWADTPEVYDPATDTWTLLTGVSTPQVHETEYPFSYLLPSGKVFTIGTEEDNSFLLDVDNRTWTPVGGPSTVQNGSSVMYLPGKVLYSGGGADVNSPGAARKTTAVIDLNAPTPVWQQTAQMNSERVYHTLTMLPDGKVLAVGGNTNTDQNIVTSGVLPMEIWDPATQTWTSGPSMAVSRNYHSTALLMPDGRVLVAGGGHPFDATGPAQYSAQYYSPGYLSAGPRPTITSAPAGATYGSSMSVATPDASSISAVSLVSLGSNTHQLDMNQHFVPLSFTSNGSGLSIQAPASAALAPPGFYMLFILNSAGVPSVASMVQLSASPTAPAAPSNVTALPGSASATVAWAAPPNSGSPVTSYTVTPYIGSTAQTPTTVTGTPPATTATVNGLTNGTAYTFKVTATNAVGTSPESAPSGAVTPGTAAPPTFIQQKSIQIPAVSTASVIPTANLTLGNRLIVQVGVWNSAAATIDSVSDSAGDQFIKLVSWKGPDNTEQSIWTAPVTSGAGSKPSITAHATSAADIGINAMEYAGLSTLADASVVEQMKTAAGNTTSAATVSSGATGAAVTNNSLAIGFYADSGFGTALTGGAGWTVRANMSPNGHMDLLAEDMLTTAGATANASVGTGPNTVWELGTLIFKPAAAGAPTAPGVPTGVTAAAGNGQASVSWAAPNNGGSPITSYTITPYAGSTALAPATVTGSPPAATATITGLTNGTAYTFTVSAANAIGASAASSASNPVTPANIATPAFVQQASTQTAGVATLSIALPGVTVQNNRLVVEVGVWNSAGATVSAVADNAGNTYTRITSVTASEKTHLSIWTAPITNGGTIPTITAIVTSAADVGIAVAEYSGLSAAAGVASVDRFSTGTGQTTAAATVGPAATAAATADVELAIGFYADSGFGTALAGDPTCTTRVNLSPNAHMDILIQDALVNTGATPAPGVTTGANTVWLMATVIFRHA